MSRFSSIVVPFILLIWVGSLVVFMRYSQTIIQKNEERKLEYAVNYATDAAVDAMVESTSDLGLDYTEYEKMNARPDVAMDMFLDIFCKNYGFALTESNYQFIKTNYLSAFAVAVYDGYYVAEPYQINASGARDFVFSMKQPYIYDPGDGKVYALNLSKEDAKMYDGLAIRKVAAPITKAEQRRIINASVTDTFTETIWRTREGNISGVINIPSELTSITNTNPIESITVLAYVSNVEVGFGEKTEVLGVGGARIAHADYCAAYVRDGVRLYCYSEDAPTDVSVIATYTSPQDAAEAGYYFDVSTLMKRD